MKLVALLAALAAVACTTAEPARPSPRAASFAGRPLTIAIEGIAERRQLQDVTFVGIGDVQTLHHPNLRGIAAVLERFVRLSVVTPNGSSSLQCPTLEVPCMLTVGARLGAKHLLWGQLALVDTDLELAFFVADVKAGRVLREFRERMPLERFEFAPAQQLAERGRIAVLGVPDSTLLVESEVDGTLYVDGASQGKLAVPRSSVRVQPGKHRITIESRGYASTERELEIPASHYVRVVVRP